MKNSGFRLTKKLVAVSLSLVLLVPILAACGKTGEKDQPKESVLRIATTIGGGYDNEYIRREFTEIFEFQNPNITLEFTSIFDDRFRYGNYDPNAEPFDAVAELKKVMDSPTPPDIVMVNYEELADLILENRLTALNPLMTKDKIELSEFAPAIIDGLKKAGGIEDGNLYALAPLFSSSALIYNKGIFDEMSVAYPTDQMTWDQMFDLARSVANGEGDDRKYGFSFTSYRGNDMFNDMNVYAAPLGLTMFDVAGETMTVDTEGWASVWEKMVSIKQEDFLPGPIDYNKPRDENTPYNPFEYDTFLSGQVAMTIIQNSQLNEIINANKSAASIEGFTPIDWDIVTVPVHQEKPDVGGYMYMSGIMGINSKALNPDDAWKLISFLNGESWAKIKGKSSYNLVTRKEFNEKKEGLDYNIDAFFDLTPAENQYNTKAAQNPNYWQIQSIGQQKMQEVINGDKTVQEALAEWQTEGNSILQQAKDNPNGGGVAIPFEKQAVQRAAGM